MYASTEHERIKIYNSSLKPFGLDSPNQLFLAIYLVMQLFLLLKVMLSLSHSKNH